MLFRYESSGRLKAVKPPPAGEYTQVLLHNAKEYSTCRILAPHRNPLFGSGCLGALYQGAAASVGGQERRTIVHEEGSERRRQLSVNITNIPTSNRT